MRVRLLLGAVLLAIVTLALPKLPNAMPGDPPPDCVPKPGIPWCQPN